MSNSSRKGSGFCCFVIDGNPLTSNPIVTGLTDPPAGFEHCTNLQLFDIEIDPEGTIYGGGTFGNPSNCWPGGAKRVNADKDEFASQVSCGVWKFEKGQQDSVSVFFAVNSFEEGDLLDPFGTPYDEFEQSFIIAREVDKKDGERYFTPYTTVGRDIENNIIVIEIDRF